MINKEFTPEQWDQISAFMDKWFFEKPCYICGSSEWIVYDGKFALIDSKSAGRIGRHSSPSNVRYVELIAIRCGTCGNVITFNARQVFNE